jgi:4-phospho-D-threonate 3-dehydrogenase / 4-phospho-D-erythronate 3-dehydrogenase
MKSALPIVGIMTGDPNGIGPEVTVKAWASGSIKSHCRPLIVGSRDVVEQAVRATALGLAVRSASDPRDTDSDPGVIDVLESAPYAGDARHYGGDLAVGGAATGAWIEHLDGLAREGQIDACVMGPISGKAMQLAGTLGSVPSYAPVDPAYLLLRSGRLVIAHLTDHMPLREVSAVITVESVYRLIACLSHFLNARGVSAGRIAVAGFNPHASGDEEKAALEPAVARARSQGIAVEGPISPDSVFRQCIEGRFDAVIALYHDQGHIAIKTWGFSCNSVLFLGPPYVHTSVAHGTAYDIVGTGHADPSMMLNAILDAASLAAGQGFSAI